LMNDEQRRANRWTALLVLGGMMVLAAMAVVFTLATTQFRRLSDFSRPDMPSLGRSLIISLGIFAIAVAGIWILAWWINRRRP